MEQSFQRGTINSHDGKSVCGVKVIITKALFDGSQYHANSVNSHQRSTGSFKNHNFPSVVSFRHKFVGFFRTSVIMVSDHDLSCFCRTRPIYIMEFALGKLLLAVVVYVLSGNTDELKVRYLKLYFSENSFRVIAYTMVTGGRTHHSEPLSMQCIDKQTKQLFQGAGWYQFLSKFTDENYRVARQFTESYDGRSVVIGSISFVAYNAFISQVTGLPQIGEPWFKGKTLVVMDCNSFLKNEYKDPDWKDRIPTKWLKDEWHGAVEVIQKFITCDFHFTRVTIYL